MIDAFWGKTAEKLADRWAAVSGAAAVFWTGIVLALALSQGGSAFLDHANRDLAHRGLPTQALALGAALIAVAASGLAMQRLSRPALRLFEGYWPARLRRIRDRRLKDVEDQLTKLGNRWDELYPIVFEGSPTRAEAEEFAVLDDLLRHYPSASVNYMPTRVGNILRAAETRPTDRYGLGVVALWPHLWSLLPDPLRQDLAAARLALDNAVAACLWSAAFLFCATPLTPWAAIPALAAGAAAWFWWIPDRARSFADLIQAAFDLHRLDLYRALGFPAPISRETERAAGQNLTQHVLRGIEAGAIVVPPAN